MRERNRTISVDGVATEKQVEHLGDKIMATAGFEIIRFSQPRRSMQTPGIPDRKYYHPVKKMAVWWEAKRKGGKQSFAQQDFQSMVQNCGEEYVCGTDDELVEWLRWKGLVR